MIKNNDKTRDYNILFDRLIIEIEQISLHEFRARNPNMHRTKNQMSSEAVLQEKTFRWFFNVIVTKIKPIRKFGGWVWVFINLRKVSKAAFESQASNNTALNLFEERSNITHSEMRIQQQAFATELHQYEKQINDLKREILFQQLRLSRVKPTNDLAPASNNLPDDRLDSLYVAFEKIFRGSEDHVKRRMAPYLNEVQMAGAGRGDKPLLDVGCGRGEWLELLKASGLQAYGIDANAMMVEYANASNLDVKKIDLMEHLKNIDNSSLSGITAFHVVEHLPFEVLIDFLDEAARTIASGGVLILETPNPENIRVGATTFYLDPTHRNPIPPDTLRFLVEHRGFTNIELNRHHPNDEQLEGSSKNIARLNELLFGPQDYSVCARRL